MKASETITISRRRTSAEPCAPDSVYQGVQHRRRHQRAGRREHAAVKPSGDGSNNRISPVWCGREKNVADAKGDRSERLRASSRSQGSRQKVLENPAEEEFFKPRDEDEDGDVIDTEFPEALPPRVPNGQVQHRTERKSDQREQGEMFDRFSQAEE